MPGGEPVFVSLLFVVIAANYVFGIWLAAIEDLRTKPILLCLAITTNLAGLVWFKYSTFIASLIGAETPRAPPHLPLGISFFTFHAISYLIDIKRGDAGAERNPARLALYISMFPQLVAGPTVRYKNIYLELPERKLDLGRLALGARLFALGLGQKVLIADVLASCADQIFSLSEFELTTPTAWIDLWCYSLQIYFDFSGYSHMAIGFAHMLGFTFPENFNFPYVSRSVTEFCGGGIFHFQAGFAITSIFRLEVSRGGQVRTYVNLWIVFLLCGLWHGASLNFVAWGAYHGLLLVWERSFAYRILQQIWSPFAHLYLLLSVAMGWVLFRCDTFSHAGYFYRFSCWETRFVRRSLKRC